MKKRKALVVVLSSVLVFVVLVSSCICNTYSYYFDAMKVKRMFYENIENFENVVEYLVSKNLKKGQTIELDSNYADPKISDDLASIGSPHIEYKYYDDPGYVLNEHAIRFYYSYSSSELYLKYSSNDYDYAGKRSGYYEWKFERLCDNWFLNYETTIVNKKG